jgi:hypothetical protein
MEKTKTGEEKSESYDPSKERPDAVLNYPVHPTDYDQFRGRYMSVKHRLRLFEVGIFLSRVFRYSMHGNPLEGLSSLERECHGLLNKVSELRIDEEGVQSWNDMITRIHLDIRKDMRFFNPKKESKSRKHNAPIYTRMKDYLMGYRRK